MQASAARRLLEINREFYDRFADAYAESRSALNPGIRRAVEHLRGRRSLLDLGCGDGRVGRALATGVLESTITRYVGLDASARLLARFSGWPGFTVLQADLAEERWWERPELDQGPFEAALCAAVLHHLPGEARRLRCLRRALSLLAEDGRLILSVWQLLHLPRLRRKVVPWSEAGLAGSALDRGDLLVDWRREGHGLRYVHHFDIGEMEDLCRRAGAEILESYRSDGQTGDLALYLILAPSRPAGGTRQRERRRPQTGG